MKEDMIIDFLVKAKEGVPDVFSISGRDPNEPGPEDDLGVRMTLSMPDNNLVVLAVAGVLREDGKPGVRYARFDGDGSKGLEAADQWIKDQNAIRGGPQLAGQED